MATSFHEILLDKCYSHNSEGGPEWATAIERSGEGGAVSHRNINREDYISKYEIHYDELTDAERKALRDFAVLRRGQAFGFRFMAFDNCKLNHDLCGFLNPATGEIERLNESTGTDGTKNEFYIMKRYKDAASVYDRQIVKPSPLDAMSLRFEPVGNPSNGVTYGVIPNAPTIAGHLPTTGSVESNPQITVNYATGKITWTNAPIASYLIFVETGTFHLPVCFTDDWHKVQMDAGAISNFGVGIEELLPVELA
jgi:uncharacterized protein (TIGR02217 family)